MKIKKVMLLLLMVLIFSGCSPEYFDETPVCSYTLKSEATKGNNSVETGTVAGSIEKASKMEGKFIKYRTKNEEESAFQAPEPAEEPPNIDLCVGLSKEIFEQTNAERIAAGIEPLTWSNELAEYANIRAEEIITNFSHIRDDGTKCYALSDLIYGENIARGPHATGAEFLEHWMDSKGHKENILNPQYTTIGIGTTCTEQGDTAVQLLGIN